MTSFAPFSVSSQPPRELSYGFSSCQRFISALRSCGEKKEATATNRSSSNDNATPAAAVTALLSVLIAADERRRLQRRRRDSTLKRQLQLQGAAGTYMPTASHLGSTAATAPGVTTGATPMQTSTVSSPAVAASAVIPPLVPVTATRFPLCASGLRALVDLVAAESGSSGESNKPVISLETTKKVAFAFRLFNALGLIDAVGDALLNDGAVHIGSECCGISDWWSEDDDEDDSGREDDGSGDGGGGDSTTPYGTVPTSSLVFFCSCSETNDGEGGGAGDVSLGDTADAISYREAMDAGDVASAANTTLHRSGGGGGRTSAQERVGLRVSMLSAEFALRDLLKRLVDAHGVAVTSTISTAHISSCGESNSRVAAGGGFRSPMKLLPRYHQDHFTVPAADVFRSLAHSEAVLEILMEDTGASHEEGAAYSMAGLPDGSGDVSGDAALSAQVLTHSHPFFVTTLGCFCQFLTSSDVTVCFESWRSLQCLFSENRVLSSQLLQRYMLQVIQHIIIAPLQCGRYIAQRNALLLTLELMHAHEHPRLSSQLTTSPALLCNLLQVADCPSLTVRRLVLEVLFEFLKQPNRPVPIQYLLCVNKAALKAFAETSLVVPVGFPSAAASSTTTMMLEDPRERRLLLYLIDALVAPPEEACAPYIEMRRDEVSG